MNLVGLLQDRARERPDQPALVEARRTIAFAELDDRSARAAGLLRASGLGPGDPVLVLQPLSIELYVALLGLWRLGATAVLLDPSAGRDHVERCCELVPPAALVAAARAHWLRVTVPALRRIPRKFSIGLPVPGAVSWGRLQRVPPLPSVEPCAPDAPALLTFTSGSTGLPKAAVRTHGFLLAQHRVQVRCLGLTPGEADLTTLPVFALANLGSGVTSILPDADLRRPGAIDPAPVVRQVRRHRPTSTAASPAFLERLADHCEREGTALPEFERVFTGGAPVFPRQLRRLAALAPRARVAAVYGSTEAEPIAEVALEDVSEPDFAAMEAGAGLLAGRPVEDLSLRVLPDRWGEPLGPFSPEAFQAEGVSSGEAGEIVVSGDHVLTGYLGGRGDEETKIRVGGRVWHRTGDAGRLDGEGRLWLLGRCAARLSDGAYPFPLECAALSREGVRRAAAAEVGGRRVLALELEGREGRSAEDALRTELVPARVDEVRVVERIPVDRRHNAKVDYPALRLLLGEAKGGAVP